MARSKSSNRWMEEHVNDPYVKRAQADSYRSRASYKLLELIDKDKLVRPGMLVLDLGSTPGGWSQVVAPLVGADGLPQDGQAQPRGVLVGPVRAGTDRLGGTVADPCRPVLVRGTLAEVDGVALGGKRRHHGDDRRVRS